MADFELVMPKMGESIMEATILSWLKQVGDPIDEDETLLEIATDKVDSEIPSPVEGTIQELRYKEGDVVKVGEVIALISTSQVSTSPGEVNNRTSMQKPDPVPASAEPQDMAKPARVEESKRKVQPMGAKGGSANRFYSPLVRNIASAEGISQDEMDRIPGTGLDQRVTKMDILQYVEHRSAQPRVADFDVSPSVVQRAPAPKEEETTSASISIKAGSGDEIVEMDRMRKLIAKHMVDSKKTSPHVTSFVEADVTELFDWRQRNKGKFAQKFGTKLTFTPIFIQAVCQAIHDFPMINSSLQGDHIIVKKQINIGMATALPSGNLIVPVIKNADTLNLAGLAKQVNHLAQQARENQLEAADIQDGTFTLTNVGTFGNVMGTPIINQPQVAILATGAIRKKPAVVETKYGDLIAVRKMMFLSLSYDHRIVDGFLGGSFLRKVADNLEQFDIDDLL